MINPQTRVVIKEYLEGYINGLVDQRRPAKPAPHPLNDDLPFEGFFLTKLGSTFEECARLIATKKYKTARRSFVAIGQMPAAAASRIEQLVNQIASEHKPNFLHLIDDVLKIEDQNWVERPVVADLYLESDQGNRYFFEIKSPKPNKGQCLEIAERLLRVHAITQENRPKVNAYFAMAYNPYGPRREDYKHSFSLQYLDMKNEVLLGDEFWEVVGGKGTYEELLEIYREVGREKTKSMMDALLFGF